MSRLVGIALVLAGCGSDSHPVSASPQPPDPGPPIVFVPNGCVHEVTVPGAFGPVTPSAERYGEHPEPAGIHLSFPTEDASTAIAFAWSTGRPDGDEPADLDTWASSVQIGTSAKALDRTAVGWSFVAYQGERDPARRLHEVHVCGLEPGTTYWYRVGGQEAWSDVRSFKTAPRAGEGARVLFAVVGDTRGDDEDWDHVAEAADAFDPDFLVHTGDATTVGYRIEEWELFFDKAADLLAHAPLLFVRGNHEENYDEGHAMQQAEIVLPGNERWYETRYGDLHFVGLADWPLRRRDADDAWIPDDIGGVERDFIEDVLCSTDATWKLAMHHRPPYNTGSNYGHQEDLQETWCPVFDECDVDLDLAGHDHIYERTLPIRGGEVVAPGEGTVYLTVAGGGAPLYSVADPIEDTTATTEAVHHFGIVDVAGGTLVFTAYRVDPEDPKLAPLLDEFTIEK